MMVWQFRSHQLAQYLPIFNYMLMIKLKRLLASRVLLGVYDNGTHLTENYI